VVEQLGEVILQITHIAAREGPGDQGRGELRVLQRRPVRGVGAGCLGQQQRGAELGGHRSPTQDRHDIGFRTHAAGGDERHLMRGANTVYLPCPVSSAPAAAATLAS